MVLHGSSGPAAGKESEFEGLLKRKPKYAVHKSFLVKLFLSGALTTIVLLSLATVIRKSSTDDIPRRRMGAADCKVEWYTQALDHYDPTETRTFSQRILIASTFWKKNGPIFFYCGNEGDVTLYANNTGLMWENAKDLGALIIFAEHRYYGKSLPFPKSSNTASTMKYLTHEQALADYAAFLTDFKTQHNADKSPVIAFGGSYGGMLAAWFRMSYPAIIDGAIAASAPILAFSQVKKPEEFNGNRYWDIVTRDATPAAGASSHCAGNVKKVWPLIKSLGSDRAGKETLTKAFRLCKPMATSHDVTSLALYLMVAFDTLAMGNYPYPSSYLTNDMGASLLPAYPVRAACDALDSPSLDGVELLRAMREAAGVYNNASKSLSCFTLPTSLIDFDETWDWQWCTEMLPQETYFDTNGVTDMFWERKINASAIASRCEKVWGVTPRSTLIKGRYGDSTLKGASNIVFSNGMLDPWSAGGVLEKSLSMSSSIVVVKIPEGAHHLDLFYSDPRDPPSVTAARKIEVENIKKWVNEAQEGASS